MNKFWVIVGQVYKKNVKSLGFLVMMLSPIVLLGIIAAVIHFVGDSIEEPPEVALITETPAVRQALAAEEEYFLINEDIQTVEEAQAAMQEEELDGYLTITQEDGILNAQYIHLADANSLDMNYLSAQLSGLQLSLSATELGLSQEQLSTILSPANVSETTLSFSEAGEAVLGDNEGQMMQRWSAYGVSIAIFMFIMTYSSIIAEEIASEKGTRIMEVILSSVSSTMHFFGKLVAIFLICMTQVAFYALIFALATQLDFIRNLIPEGIDLSIIVESILGFSLYYFIMGIILYAVVAAFLGSLVTKIEDVSKAVTPVVFIALTGFYGGMFAFAGTSHPLIGIGSHIPFFTPFIMPFRIAAETVSTTELWISVFTMAAFTALLTYFSLLLYRSNVLLYGDSGMLNTMKTSIRNLREERRHLQKA